MLTETPELKHILERLSRVEGQNHRIKFSLCMLFVGLGGLFLMGQASIPKVPEVIEAQKFILRDSQGRGRAMLGFTLNNAPVLLLNQTDGNLGATIEVAPQGQPTLSLYDRAGKPRAILSVDTDSSAGLTFGDATGKARVSLAVSSPDKSAGLVVYDNSGQKPLALLGLTRDGLPALIVSDDNGKPGLVIANAKAQAALTGLTSSKADYSMSIVGKAGKVIWSAP